MYREYLLSRMAHLYILRLVDGTHYCGITGNIVTRVQRHNRGGVFSTKRKLPVILKFLKRFESMREARVMEKMIKQQGVTRWYVKNQHREDNEIKIASAMC